MSDEVEVAKAGIDLVEKYADTLGDALSQYGPQAADLALAVGRVGAIKDVLTACILLAIGLPSLFFAVRRILREGAGKGDLLDYNPMVAVPCGALAGLALFFTFKGMAGVLNIYAWAGLFHPEIYLVAKALNL